MTNGLELRRKSAIIFLRATGIIDCLKSEAPLAKVHAMPKHDKTRTMQLYDRREDVVSLDEYGRVGILAGCW